VRKVLVAAFSVLAVAACGGGATNTASTPPRVNFTMAAQNGSTATGTGQIVKASDSFTLTIKLTGMVPMSSHISHIHAGGCGVPGGIVFALQQVIADASGAATATTIVPAKYLVPSSGWYVNVHTGPDFTEPDYAPSTSCGDLSAA
jgi:CHRD domain